MEPENGVMIGGTCGAVARAGRLTVLVGDADEPFAPDSHVPGEALHMADDLAAHGDWEFETVAAALQEFVIAHDPPGVAAVLEGDEETMVFLFDQAEAIEFDDDEDPQASVRVQRGVGRSGWTTELVTGPWIQLRLGLDPVVPWTELRWGVAIGSTATILVAGSVAAAAPIDVASVHQAHEAHDDGTLEDEVQEVVAHDHVDDAAAPLDLVQNDPVHDDGMHEEVAVVRTSEPMSPDDDELGDIGAAVAATAPFAASGLPDVGGEEPTDEHPRTDPGDDLATDPAIDGWDEESTGAEPVTGQQVPTIISADPRAEDPELGAEHHHDPIRSDDPPDDRDGQQQTVVVDPSQIGLTRLGDDGVPDQPPAPNLAAPPGAPPSGEQVFPTTPPPPRPGQPPMPPPAAGHDQPPAPPPGTAPSAEQPPPPPGVDPGPLRAPADGTAPSPDQPPAPPPGTAPSPDQPPAPPPGTAPSPDQPPAPGAGQPPAPPGLGRTLAPGPAPDGRPEPPPPGPPIATSRLDPPPPGPGHTPPTPSASNNPQPPPPGEPAPPPANGQQARTVVGYLIDADDENVVHPISGPTIIGADPASDPEVVIGAATMITIDDPSVHEVHVRIKVTGHEVTAEDAGFGGSWVQTDGGPMKMLTPDGERLLPGCQLRVGTRVLLFRLAAAPVS